MAIKHPPVGVYGYAAPPSTKHALVILVSKVLSRGNINNPQANSCPKEPSFKIRETIFCVRYKNLPDHKICILICIVQLLYIMYFTNR
jgi:hypothetical protein